MTGGAGFIGSHVCATLESAGYEPVVFDHRGRGDGVRMLGDVRDRVAVTELAAHVDGIVHLAAVLGTQETIGNPWPAAETNILGGVNVLNACRQYDIPVVYAGVGNFQMFNTYSTTKTATERLFRQYHMYLGLRAVVVRPMNAYGPGQGAAVPFSSGRVRKIVPAFACRALSGMPVEVYGDGSQISDMVHVSDVAATFVAALEAAEAGLVPDYPIEVGPVVSTSVAEVAGFVVEAAAVHTGSRVPVTHLPMRPGEMSDGALPHSGVDFVVDMLEGMGVDARLARQVARPLSNRVNADVGSMASIGVDPEGFVPLEVGLAETVDWFAKVEGSVWHRP